MRTKIVAILSLVVLGVIAYRVFLWWKQSKIDEQLSAIAAQQASIRAAQTGVEKASAESAKALADLDTQKTALETQRAQNADLAVKVAQAKSWGELNALAGVS